MGLGCLAALLGCDTGETPHTYSPGPCQGDEAYCDRPYNQVAQLCTHNAMSSPTYDFILPTPNQAYGLTRQLDDGVRCLMLDTYRDGDGLYLCHGLCAGGKLPLTDGLAEVQAWLAANPREVVTFILEPYISEEETFGALVASGLAHPSGTPHGDHVLYHHDRAPGSPWPTMGHMVDNNQRLVVFTTDEAANGTWHLRWPDYGWETPFGDPAFGCDHGRGEPTRYDHQIFILNHYTLCDLGGCEEHGLVNNTYDFVRDRAVSCWQSHPQFNPWAQIPTFINLDQYHVPDTDGVPQALLAAQALNEMWPTAGSP